MKLVFKVDESSGGGFIEIEDFGPDSAAFAAEIWGVPQESLTLVTDEAPSYNPHRGLSDGVPS